MRTVGQRCWLKPPGEISCVIYQQSRSFLQVGDEKRKYSSSTRNKCAVGLQGKTGGSYEAAVFGKPQGKDPFGSVCLSLFFAGSARNSMVGERGTNHSRPHQSRSDSG